MGNAAPAVSGRAVPREVIQERQRIGFSASKLRRHVEHRAGLGDSTRKSAEYLGREAGEILSEEGAVEEPLRILVVVRSGSRANLIQMHGEFGGIDRFAFPQVFSRFGNVVPWLQLHFPAILRWFQFRRYRLL